SLPPETKQRARRAYRLWRANPRHPSLRFKKTGTVGSVRVDPNYRTLGLMEDETMYWFWIGAHDEYERLIACLS
ncbi:MAG: hypothetical protein B6240_06490, partial [Desulfobacteraceae bacterium 4572_87]